MTAHTDIPGLVARLREGASRVAKHCMGGQTKPLISIPVRPDNIDVVMADAADMLETLSARLAGAERHAKAAVADRQEAEQVLGNDARGPQGKEVMTDTALERAERFRGIHACADDYLALHAEHEALRDAAIYACTVYMASSEPLAPFLKRAMDRLEQAVSKTKGEKRE